MNKLYFNTAGCDEDESNLLLQSLHNIKSKSDLRIVSDQDETVGVLKKITKNFRSPHSAHFSIQNLFKIESNTIHFYVIQCRIDFGYPEDIRKGISWGQRYNFQLIAFAELITSTGNIEIRPETLADKWVNRFLKNDIELDNADRFNKTYKIAADNPPQARKVLNSKVVKAFRSATDVHVRISENQIIIGFETELNVQQSGIAENIMLELGKSIPSQRI